MDFRKTFYILPNLFTLSSVMCGFASLALSSGPGEEDLYLSALAICFGFFFDTFDGRVARLTKTQTDLGRDLDSLADVITFGAAPAFLVYKWALEGSTLGRLGIFVSGLYVCAGALRLARFNVLDRREKIDVSGAEKKSLKPSKYTVGLSIPPAASVLVFMVIVSHNAGDYKLLSEGSTAAVVVILSVLMVSRVRFRSFKDVRMTKRTVGILLLIVGSISATMAAGFRKGAIFLVLVCTYIGLGLAEEVIFFRSRRAANTPAPPPDPLREQREDEEVLRELGAYDDAKDEPDAPGAEGAPAAGKTAGEPTRS